MGCSLEAKYLSENQQSHEEAVANWIKSLLSEREVNLAFTTKALEQMDRHQIDLQDVLYVLESSENIQQDYPGGCYTVRGDTVDAIVVSIVITPRSEKNRIKVVTVWRGEAG